MNRQDAKKIADKITNKELVEMFRAAKEGVRDWSVVSACNKGFSKGLAWNILAKDFDKNKEYHYLAKVNMIREFGEFLPGHMKIQKPNKNDDPVKHQEPDFSNWE